MKKKPSEAKATASAKPATPRRGGQAGAAATPPGKRKTIMDVAREAGVDFSTVSLALRKDPRIRAETREQIEAAAKRIGYFPNRLARSLSGGTTKVIGVMLTEMSRFFATPLEALQDAGEAADYTLSIHFSWWDTLREQKGMQQFCESCVEGVIWAPSSFDTATLRHSARLLANAKIPVVTLGLMHDNNAPDLPLHQIGVNIRQGLRLGLEHLVNLGHRNIGIVTATTMGGQRGDVYRMRLNILCELCQEMGIRLLPKNTFSTDDPEHGAIEIAIELSHRPRAERPTAIFVAEDSLTRGLARCLHALNIKVPDDISLLGYDVTSNHAIGDAPLATVTLERGQIATHAMRLLLDLIRNKGDVSSTFQRIITVPPVIADLGSTAPLRLRSSKKG